MRQFNLILAIVLSYASLVGYLITPLSAEEIHTYGPIKPRDMLWNIAAKVGPPSVSRHQVILALQQANPQAFSVPCNINSLKVGETLRIPSLTEMQAFTSEKAITELNRQNEEWQNRHNQSIVCPPITPPVTATTSQPATTEAKQIPASEPDATKTTVSQPEVQPATENIGAATVQPEQVTPSSHSTTSPVNVAQTSTPPTPSPTTPSVSSPPATTNPTTADNQLALVPETVETGDLESAEPPSPTIPITREPSKPENPYLLNDWNSAKLIAVVTIASIMLILLFMGLRKKSVKRNLAKQEKLENYTFTEPIAEMPLQFEQYDKPSS